MVNVDTPLYYLSDSKNAMYSVQSALLQSEAENATMLTKGLAEIDATKLSGSQFEHTLIEEVGKYINATDNLVFQNEIYNTNMYMKESMQSQEDQIGELSEKARNHIMRLRQKYQLKMYDISYYKFITTLFLYSLFISALSALLLMFAYKFDPPMLSPVFAWVTVGITVVVFLIIVLLYVRNNSSRRKMDWTKYNFGSNGIPKQSCSA